MFTVTFKRLYFVCNNMIIRSLRNNRLGFNPGLGKRVGVFKKEGVNLEAEDVEDFIEESEGNFFQAGNIYKEHIENTQTQRDALRHQIVKQKYFKENFPNLLTWSEKEQIRHLSSQEPEEWTPEKIAESFPISTIAVKKLLKYPWQPATEQRIARHDASAMRNWRELKEGTLNIPPELREHLLKFSERTIPPLNKKSVKIDLTPAGSIGEFQAIIDKCAPKETSNVNNYELVDCSNIKDHDSDKENKLDKKHSSKRFTLDELSNRIKAQMEMGNEVEMPDQIIVDQVSETQITSPNTMSHDVEIHKEAALTCFNNKQFTEVQIKTYPERIRIPKKAYKKGATYKIDDCYYDDDGRFLYRVIGMTN